MYLDALFKSDAPWDGKQEFFYMALVRFFCTGEHRSAKTYTPFVFFQFAISSSVFLIFSSALLNAPRLDPPSPHFFVTIRNKNEVHPLSPLIHIFLEWPQCPENPIISF